MLRTIGVWYNFNILWLDSSPRIPIFGEMGKLSQISPKVWRCPHSPTCRNQTAQHMKTGKYSFKRGIIALHFAEKRLTSLYLFRRKRGGLVVQVSFKSVAIALLSFARWRRYTERTQRRSREWRNSSHLVLHVAHAMVVRWRSLNSSRVTTLTTWPS